MRFAASLVASALLFGSPAVSQTRLTDQFVSGWKRICSYEDLRPTPAGARNRRTYAVEVGRGEPCPYRYTAPTPVVRRRTAPAQPAATRTPQD